LTSTDLNEYFPEDTAYVSDDAFEDPNYDWRRLFGNDEEAEA
jgi:hypothetical protein